MTAVSVIGLGRMGAVLAGVMLDAGHRVTVWNRTPDKAADLVARGARLAASPGEAVDAGEVTLVCIRSHSDTRTVLEPAAAALRGRTIVELSTGDAAEARALKGWVEAQGAGCLVGMIAVFPKDIGKPDSAILVAGETAVWEDAAPVLKALAGASARIGADPMALAAIYAGLVLPRQGFMFGMIHGAIICARADIPAETYVQALPLTLRIVHDYHDLFAATVPEGRFDDPPASLAVYHAALADVVRTCGDLGAPDELPRLLRDLLQKGMDAGLGDRQVTVLTRLLAGE